MPNLDGLGVAKILNDLKLNVKIIVLSSCLEHKKILSQPNIIACTTKPIRKTQLLKLISHSININPCIIENSTTQSLCTNTNIFDKNKNKKILIAEDNEINRLTIVKILKNLNFQVLEAKNGIEVIDIVEINSVDIILIDIHMPLMDGIEATKIIKSKGIKVPVVALTADISTETNNICKKIGMVDYINKPVKTSKLQSVINNIINE